MAHSRESFGYVGASPSPAVRTIHKIPKLVQHEETTLMTGTDNQSAIKNCSFQFKCTKTWQELEVKIDYAENKRFCNQCTQDVYLVQNDAELKTAVLNNYCVAIPGNILINEAPLLQGDWETPPTTVGVLLTDMPIAEPELPSGSLLSKFRIVFYLTLIGLFLYFLFE